VHHFSTFMLDKPLHFGAPLHFAANHLKPLAVIQSVVLMAAAAPVPDVVKLFSLQGKTAIVTGSTGGLGTAMTMALAAGGADIVSIELPNDPGTQNTKDNVTKIGRKIRQYECNVGDSKELRATYQKIWSDGIKADILLNCKGCCRLNGAPSNLSS
jgi:hypothetical protein